MGPWRCLGASVLQHPTDDTVEGPSAAARGQQQRLALWAAVLAEEPQGLEPRGTGESRGHWQALPALLSSAPPPSSLGWRLWPRCRQRLGQLLRPLRDSLCCGG